MMVFRCDLCTSEVDKVVERDYDGFEKADICKECDENIESELDRLKEQAEKSRDKKLRILGFEPIDENHVSHEHTWSDGWVENLRNKRILHKVCTFSGCHEEQVS